MIMATAAAVDADVVRQTVHYKVSAIICLFGGRFSADEINTLLIFFEENEQETANFLLKSEPRVIRERLEAELQSWTTVQRVKELRKDRVKVHRAASGTIPTQVRQFACQPCDNAWWRRVPENKMVSKCNRCRNRYEPVPRNKEWGIGVFQCARCQGEFWGWIQMGNYSVCRICGTQVYPTRILPPHERARDQRRKYEHSCECCGVFGKCAHPQARRREGVKVMFPSNIHISSGSTVATFLPQDDLQADINMEEVYDRVSPIPELPEDDADD